MEMEGMVQRTFLKVGLETKNFYDPLHFDIPDYPFAMLPFKNIDHARLDEWSYARSLANHMLIDIGSYLQREVDVRIWPYNFDTGIYIQRANDLGIGSGLAMEDSMARAPYFFKSGYTGEYQIEYTEVQPLSQGKWMREDLWKGGILPISILKPANVAHVVRIFYAETLDFYI
jgi:hypothetical protein